MAVYRHSLPLVPRTADALDISVDGRESDPLFCTAAGVLPVNLVDAENPLMRRALKAVWSYLDTHTPSSP